MKTLKNILVAVALVASLALQAQNGVYDPTFGGGTGFAGRVNQLAIQTDGKVIAVGELAAYNDGNVPNIVRLNANGSLDATFNTGAGPDYTVNAVVLQPDGKIIMGGRFSEFNGTDSNYIARLNANGTLDTSFQIGSGPDDYVETMALQPDGKVIIGGYFENVNGVSRKGVARLNANGSLDTSFNPGSGTNAELYDLLLQPDGKILMAGYFTTFNGNTQNRLARLNADGSLDASFNIGSGASGEVYTLALQSDGKILLAGFFSSFNGTPAVSMVRLQANGAIDTSFNPGTGAPGTVYDLVAQSDGKILAAGAFSSFNGTTRSGIARLNADGSVDTQFNPGTGIFGGFQVGISLALQADGKIVLGGEFDSYDGHTAGGIVRITNTILGIDESTKPQVAIYPNPVHNDVTLQCTDATIRSVRLTDSHGSNVLKTNYWTASSPTRIDLSSLSSGVYVLTVETDKGWQTIKIIKD
ncbi:MAG: T9SS type A sorting domain-containing protein [Gelidibacter sp.]